MSETTTRETTMEAGRELTERQREIIRHSLGLNRSSADYRNYFATHEDERSPDYRVIRELVAAGLMARGRVTPAELGGMVYFHVTDAGRVALASLSTPTREPDEDEAEV